MKKVYVMGADDSMNARTVLGLDDDVEVIVVASLNDVPIEDRHDLNKVQEIFKITAFPRPDIEVRLVMDDRKGRKGYERPYKYHR